MRLRVRILTNPGEWLRLVVKDRCPNLDIALLSCSFQRYDHTAEYIVVNCDFLAELKVRCRILEHSASIVWQNRDGPLMSLPYHSLQQGDVPRPWRMLFIPTHHVSTMTVSTLSNI